MILKITKKGTTLIEILMYFAIFSIFMLAAMSFALQIINLTTISKITEEMQENSGFISEKLSQSIKGAGSVNIEESVLDNDNGILYLEMRTTENSPTIFYLSENKIYIQEGPADPIQLNTNNIKVDILNFHRTTAEKTPDQIVIEIEISPISEDLAMLKRNLEIHLTLSLR
ncbi:MAG: hypothetical protein ACD_65C00011G0002 [uncultured bacterium]|nr:MAG: hypothetical protein ACD_65C00011G0002 [uncultured bacterium]KKT02832.1 MAG: hypothetical protein UV80_C0002G0299 [Candidatus Peregrinibacteria bacterium GW2011_GWF2_43_17]KKT20424.1 MAG: hypothetical protein UW03_C0004G0008 [Candidatus Peregrinibacteria bacterium GW2011_GWA2_43_8]